MIRFDFSGRSVIVSGAAQGLGRAIAADFVAAGARVFLFDVDSRTLDVTAAGLGKLATGISVDISSAEAVSQAVASVERSGTGVDILVNNAGICTTSTLTESTTDEWLRVMDVNLNGAYYLSRRVAQSMVRNGTGGRIISICSLAGRNGGLLVSPAYSASKAGLAGLTKAAARQLAPHGITVNCVAPGMLQTGMLEQFTPDGVRKVESSVPLGRLGEVGDVSAVVLFLASKQAGYITGITLDVNGGLFIAP